MEPSAVSAEIATEAAELLGIRGGILRRLSGVGDPKAIDEALASYRRGGVFEEVRHLSQTYNRANAIKLALITGDQTVAGLRNDLIALRDVLVDRLATDERAADDAWLWADLGDVRLLLGEQREAEAAYESFASKARTDSPDTTLSVITEVVRALEAHGDEAAQDATAALENVSATLRRRNA